MKLNCGCYNQLSCSLRKDHDHKDPFYSYPFYLSPGQSTGERSPRIWRKLPDVKDRKETWETGGGYVSPTSRFIYVSGPMKWAVGSDVMTSYGVLQKSAQRRSCSSDSLSLRPLADVCLSPAARLGSVRNKPGGSSGSAAGCWR